MEEKESRCITGYSFEEIKRMFRYNVGYIYENQLIIKDREIQNLGKGGYPVLHKDEIFVRIPNYSHYYISQYGSVISESKKSLKLRLIKTFPNNRGYMIIRQLNTTDQLVSRNVGFIFCADPNSKEIKELHHRDGILTNNYYKNLTWLEPDTHTEFNRWNDKFYVYDTERKNEGWKQYCGYDLEWKLGISTEDFIQMIQVGGAETIFNYKHFKIGRQLLSKVIERPNKDGTKKRIQKNKNINKINKKDEKKEERNGFLRGKRLDLYREVWKEWPN